MSSSWFYAVTDLLVGRALSPQPSIIKRAEDIALHTTELALQPTGPICFDSLACLQIAFLTFEYSLQLLVLPNVCLTITENNALTTIVPVTHLNARNPLVFVPSQRVHVPPFLPLGPGFFRQNTSGFFFFTPKACPSGWVFSQAQHPMIKTYRIGP